MRSLLIAVFGFFTLTTQGQQLVTIDDRAGVLEKISLVGLNEKLSAYNIQYSDQVSYSKRCDYKFVTIFNEGKKLKGKLSNCNDGLLALQDIDANWEDLAAEDLTFLITRFIKNNIDNDVIKKPVEEAKEIKEEEYVDGPLPENEKTLDGIVNQHDTRYLFSPSSYNLRSGELYYNTLYGLLHDVQYGLTDHFSIGMGTSVAGIPFYITPKYTFALSEKSHFSIGDLMILGTYGSNFFGNLAFATYTYGSSNNNITLGGAYFFTNQNDVLDGNSPVFNISALKQLSPYLYFLTENYLLSYSSTYWAFNNMTYESISFNADRNIWIGFVGMRFVNKKKDINSINVGLAYMFRNPISLPSTIANSEWVLSGSNWNQFALPMISYTYKFGKKY